MVGENAGDFFSVWTNKYGKIENPFHGNSTTIHQIRLRLPLVLLYKKKHTQLHYIIYCTLISKDFDCIT